MNKIQTSSIVNKKAVWSSNVDEVSNLQTVEVLRHFSTRGKLGMNILEINLHRIDKITTKYVYKHNRKVDWKNAHLPTQSNLRAQNY